MNAPTPTSPEPVIIDRDRTIAMMEKHADFCAAWQKAFSVAMPEPREPKGAMLIDYRPYAYWHGAEQELRRCIELLKGKEPPEEWLNHMLGEMTIQ